MPESMPESKPKSCNFMKKGSLARMFSCEFCDISNNPFSPEHLWTTASVSVSLILSIRRKIRKGSRVITFTGFMSASNRIQSNFSAGVLLGSPRALLFGNHSRLNDFALIIINIRFQCLILLFTYFFCCFNDNNCF